MNSPIRRFNPRAREGRDAIRLSESELLSSFNPRAREGRDEMSGADLQQWRVFQSTRPRGARHRFRLFQFGTMICFNPRAREGRDFSYCSISCL